MEVASHFLHDCQKANDWAIAQVLCDVVQLASNLCMTHEEVSPRSFVQKVIKVIQKLKLPLDKRVKTILDSKYVESHIISGNAPCETCEVPLKLKKKVLGLTKKVAICKSS